MSNTIVRNVNKANSDKYNIIGNILLANTSRIKINKELTDFDL